MDWRLIFEQSRVNGGLYTGEDLDQRGTIPVRNTWFQRRLKHVRERLKSELLARENEGSREHPDRFNH